MARPPKYDEAKHPTEAFKLSLLGLTNLEIATYWEIDESTFYAWMKNYPEFSKEVTRGKAIADAEVAAGLYKRGTGYEYESEKILTLSVGDGCSEVERVAITVHVPPDPGAALNWLKNRQPDRWRDKKQLEMEDGEGNPVAFPVVRVYSPKPEEPEA